MTIRVAMVIQAYYPHVGGAERQLMALVPLLRERGVDVHIFTRRYEGMKPFELIGGAPVHRLPIPGPKAMASLSFTLSALPRLWQLKPDLIHAHELLSPTTTAVFAKRLLGTPVAAKVLRGGELGDLAKLKRKPFGLRRIATFREQVDAFVTISQEIDGELAEIGVGAEKRPFIPNGVDLSRFILADKTAVRQQLDFSCGKLVLFVGRLSAEKRAEQLIEIWPQVRQSHPDATLLLLGAGPEEDSLRQSATDGV